MACLVMKRSLAVGLEPAARLLHKQMVVVVVTS
jgi:hypothetical protein